MLLDLHFNALGLRHFLLRQGDSKHSVGEFAFDLGLIHILWKGECTFEALGAPFTDEKLLPILLFLGRLLYRAESEHVFLDIHLNIFLLIPGKFSLKDVGLVCLGNVYRRNLR